MKKKDYLVLIYSYKSNQAFPVFMGGAEGSVEETVNFATMMLVEAHKIEGNESIYWQIHEMTDAMSAFLANGERNSQALFFTRGVQFTLSYCMLSDDKVMNEPYTLLHALDSIQGLDPEFVEFCKSNPDLLKNIQEIWEQLLLGILEKAKAIKKMSIEN